MRRNFWLGQMSDSFEIERNESLNPETEKTILQGRLLRKRVLVEIVNDQLKNVSQLEHTRHRSIGNFFVNTLASIAAYTRQPKKPHINLGYLETGLIFNF